MRNKLVILTVVIVLIVLSMLLVFPNLLSSGHHKQNTVSNYTTTVQPYPMVFSGEFAAGSYYAPTKYNQTAMQSDLDFLYSMDVNAIRFEPDYNLWLSGNTAATIELTNVVSNMRQNGKLVIVADIASQSYFSHPIPWNQFKTEWPSWVKIIAQTFKPDYYVVIKEPGWYVPMVSDAYTNPDFQNPTTWDSLAGTLADTVHSVSPNTKVAVSVAAGDFNKESYFYNSFLSNLPSNINIIGFDIFGPNVGTGGGYVSTQNYLHTYGTGGKDIWLQSIWSQTDTTAFNLDNAQSDVLWMQSVYNFALDINATMINPFFSNIFASYSPPPSTSSGLIAFYQNRTPVYYTFRSIIMNNLANTSSPPTGTTNATQ